MKQEKGLDGGGMVAQVLKSQGVPFLFTLCGGHISPILVGCKEQGIRVVDVRHESTAVFAADAVSRLTGTPGVAAVTAGPGLTNSLTALKNAQLAQSPLILLGGAAPILLKGRGALQDIDQFALIKPHVKWCTAVNRLRDIVPALERAFLVSQSGVPGPVFLQFPVDLLYPEDVIRTGYLRGVSSEHKSFGNRVLEGYIKFHLNRMFKPPAPHRAMPPKIPEKQVSPPGSLRRAVELLNQARRPVLLVGSQSTLGVADLHALRKALEDLGLPVYLSGMARGLMGKRHPLFYRHQRRQALREADLVILAGVPADFRLNYGRSISSKAVVIGVNRSRADLRLNRKPELGVLADPGTFLRDLAALSSQGQWRREDWLAQLTQREQEREAAIEGESAPAPSGINPVRLLRKLDSLLGENCILIGDGGDFVGTASYTVSPRGPLSWLDPGVFGTLGVGAGFALGAKLARPDAEVWALFGDGSVGYSLSEWDTFARHGVAVGALIGNDGSWNQIARDQVTLLKDDVGTVLRQSDYHEVARALGAQGLVLRAEEEVTPGLKHARELLRQGHPVLVNALCVRSGFREGSISI